MPKKLRPRRNKKKGKGTVLKGQNNVKLETKHTPTLIDALKIYWYPLPEQLAGYEWDMDINDPLFLTRYMTYKQMLKDLDEPNPFYLGRTRFDMVTEKPIHKLEKKLEPVDSTMVSGYNWILDNIYTPIKEKLYHKLGFDDDKLYVKSKKLNSK